ncbi:hypothetical protein E2P81_ATG03381 [Venturia nashicola]|nr:hypothetical protein E2P81_ATG03381 [Venturia nashicola]
MQVGVYGSTSQHQRVGFLTRLLPQEPGIWQGRWVLWDALVIFDFNDCMIGWREYTGSNGAEIPVQRSDSKNSIVLE